MQTTRQLLNFAARQLQFSESPRLDAEVLLAALLETDRSRFYAHPEMPVTEDAAADFMRLLNNRKAGYPVAYLTGTKEFRSIDFRVNQYTLIPRPETELLVELALKRIPRSSRDSILDLGTGSGAIAVAMADTRPYCNIMAVDLSMDALVVARQNAAATNVANITFRQSNWFMDLQNSRFDAILCNPPYVDYSDGTPAADETRYEPRMALDGGYNGTACIRIIISSAPRYINPGGFMIIEHAHDQADFVRHQFKLNNYRDIITHRDYAGHERHSSAIRP